MGLTALLEKALYDHHYFGMQSRRETNRRNSFSSGKTPYMYVSPTPYLDGIASRQRESYVALDFGYTVVDLTQQPSRESHRTSRVNSANQSIAMSTSWVLSRGSNNLART